MTRNIIIVCATAAALLLTGCGPKRVIDAEALSGVMEPVLDRHDHYVNNDPSLADTERATFLRSSEILRDMVEEALNTD